MTYDQAVAEVRRSMSPKNEHYEITYPLREAANKIYNTPVPQDIPYPLGFIEMSAVHAVQRDESSHYETICKAFAVLSNYPNIKDFFDQLTFEDAFWNVMTFGYTNSPYADEDDEHFLQVTEGTFRRSGRDELFINEARTIASAIYVYVTEIHQSNTSNMDDLRQFCVSLFTFDVHEIVHQLLIEDFDPAVEKLCNNYWTAYETLTSAIGDYSKAYHVMTRASAEYIFRNWHSISDPLYGRVVRLMVEGVRTGNRAEMEEAAAMMDAYIFSNDVNRTPPTKILQHGSVLIGLGYGNLTLNISTCKAVRDAIRYFTIHEEDIELTLPSSVCFDDIMYRLQKEFPDTATFTSEHISQFDDIASQCRYDFFAKGYDWRDVDIRTGLAPFIDTDRYLKNDDEEPPYTETKKPKEEPKKEEPEEEPVHFEHSTATQQFKRKLKYYMNDPIHYAMMGVTIVGTAMVLGGALRIAGKKSVLQKIFGTVLAVVTTVSGSEILEEIVRERVITDSPISKWKETRERGV